MRLRKALIFLVAVVTLVGVWYALDLPSDEALRPIITNAFLKYGPLMVMGGAYIEAILLVGMYFPGSFIIFLSVALATNGTEASLSVLYVTIGLYAGYITNFILGKYGWYTLLTKLGLEERIQTAQRRVQNKEIKYLFLTFWSPSIASLTTTAAGILHTNFKFFALATLCTVIVWNIFWGILVYSLGEAALTIVGFKFLIAIALAWVAYELAKILWVRYKIN